MLTMTPDELHARAERLLAACEGSLPCTLVEGTSAVGGGAFPGASLPTTLVALDPGALGAAGLALRLRLGAPPLVARVEHDRVLLDPRTLPEDSAPSIGDAIRGALSHEV
jgi:L-seryl-tRNA(Ser) seleniumtransferase